MLKLTEVACRFSLKTLFWKFLTSQNNNNDLSYFTEKRVLLQAVISSEDYGISRNSYFTEHLWLAASELPKQI